MKYGIWISIGVAVIALIAVAMWINNGTPVQIANVERGTIREFVDQKAETQLPLVHRITMPFAARLEKVSLVEGQKVEAGEVVAQVVQSDLENEVAEAQAVVDRLAQSIIESKDVSVEDSTYEQALAFVKSMVNTVASADAQKEAAKAQLEFSRERMQRLADLGQTGAASKDDVDRARLEYEQALSSFRQDDLTSQSIRTIEAATQLLPKMVKDYINRKDLGTNVLLEQKDEAEARLRQIKVKQQRGTMKSPVDGVVLTRSIENEQFVQAGTELLTIGDMDQIEIAADVLSEDVVDVRKGNEVEIYGVTLGMNQGEGITGHVQRIFPSGFTKTSSLGVEQQRVKIVIQLDDAARQKLLSRNVGSGYRVRIRVFTETASDATIVPRSSLFRGPANQWQVFKVENGRARLTDVEVGLMNDHHVQVKSGLSGDDRVIAAPEKSIADGTRVKAIKP
jgi:HlyD family secretion protein